MNQKNTLEIMAILALIVGLLGGFWGYSVTQETKQCPSEEEIVKDYVNELRNKEVVPSVPETIKQARGEITEVGENTVTIKTHVRPFDILQKHLKPKLTAEITENTRLIQVKVEEVKGSETGKTISNYTEKEIEKSELAKGQQVVVRSIQNFKGKDEFEAQTIRVQPSE